MARKYTNHDHFCRICGKRIGDGEDYYSCAYNLDICLDCEDKHGVCGMCHQCD